MNLWKRFAIAVEQRTGKSALATASFKALIIYTVLLLVFFMVLKRRMVIRKLMYPWQRPFAFGNNFLSLTLGL